MNSTMPAVCMAAGNVTPKCPNTSAAKKIALLPSEIPLILMAPTT